MMGQYKDLVERQRKLLEVEAWRKQVKEIEGSMDGLDKVWTTTYKDGSQLIETTNGLVKGIEEVSSSMTIQDCVDQISKEEQDVKHWK